MKRAWDTFMRYPIALTVGAAVGLTLSPISFGVMDWVLQGYDRWHPVVEMTGEVVGKTRDAVDIHISGEKKRDCTYIQLQAYGVRPNALHDLNIQRLGVVERGDTKQRGIYDIGTWRVWPVDGANGVLVLVQHLCAGRVVTTKIAEVDL